MQVQKQVCLKCIHNQSLSYVLAILNEEDDSESENDNLYDKSGEETLDSSFDALESSPVSRKPNKRRSKDAKAFAISAYPTSLAPIKEKVSLLFFISTNIENIEK